MKTGASMICPRNGDSALAIRSIPESPNEADYGAGGARLDGHYSGAYLDRPAVSFFCNADRGNYGGPLILHLYPYHGSGLVWTPTERVRLHVCGPEIHGTAPRRRALFACRPQHPPITVPPLPGGTPGGERRRTAGHHFRGGAGNSTIGPPVVPVYVPAVAVMRTAC